MNDVVYKENVIEDGIRRMVYKAVENRVIKNGDKINE